MKSKQIENPGEYIDSTLAQMKNVRILAKSQLVLVIICWTCIALSIWLKFTGGRSSAIISIATFGAITGVISYFIGKYIENLSGRFEEIKTAFEEAERLASTKPNPVSPEHKIPFAVGFANLIGEAIAPTVNEDVRDISRLFLRSVAPPAHQIPNSQVLFVYANLDDTGAISPDGKSGIRQIIELTNAAIVVVASPNSPESIKKAIELPGPKTANIVFTLNRNGREFGDFFSGLSEKMRDGKEMLSAWVELAPQVPAGAPLCGPQTLLIAERGKILFQSEVGSQHKNQK